MSVELQKIEEPPKFVAAIDQLLLAQLKKNQPEIGHLLERLSEESQYRGWLLDRVVLLNNTACTNAETQRQIIGNQEETNRLLDQMTREMTVVRQTGEANAKTILEWTIKFKSPLSILGALVGAAAVAALGALADRWLSK